MLTQETKRHIDAARQVLVGVVPNPSSQIDQITNALIYKFMDDMDQSAIKAGGDPSFFVGNLERYAWTRLMDSRLGNQERMNLYSEALLKFSEAKQLPDLFRGIFKSAFLPYRSPEVLGLFLKEIDYFDYSHSEELGNAYEYLLSIMGSQGDAGQFRTPRHIIDFIVAAVNPTKGDKVLDPACGTAGFLVSAYKHILEQHDGKNPDGTKNNEKPLTPDQRRALMNNFEGYDVDPGMVRISQVNLYLHNFSNPKIYNYNTLSQDERWADKFDVILANPPFMSPKGGVSTHNKFSVQSSRSEVLFVDYIMNHLRPKGRAGIIVPEGIIFQSGTAHKQLRKNLVEDGLYAVVSLPSGVFQPYSGVKTSILLFNNELAKRNTEILFVKVENDGFDLGATKRPINKNDLPQALKIIQNWQSSPVIQTVSHCHCEEPQATRQSFAIAVAKKKIAESGDYNLSGDRYRVATDYTNAKWPMVQLSTVIETITPEKKILKSEYLKVGIYPIIDQSQEAIAGWTNDNDSAIKIQKPVVIFGDHTCVVKFTDKPFAQGADGIKILEARQELLPKFLYHFLNINPISCDGYKRHFTKLKDTKIPLPPLEIQEQIVAELDGYSNIITGARQVVENWKPKIDIDPAWEKMKLGEICEIKSGGTPLTSNFSYYENGTIPWLKSEVCKDEIVAEPKTFISKEGLNNSSAKWIDKNSTLIALVGATIGKTAFITFKATTNQNVASLFPKNIKQLDPVYLYLVSQSLYGLFMKLGDGGFKMANLSFVKNLEILLPPIEIQKSTVEKIEAERELVESNNKLIKIYEQKTKGVIAKLWSK